MPRVASSSRLSNHNTHMSDSKQTVYYSFQWPYDAEEQTPQAVSVTGSFDRWAAQHSMALDTDTLCYSTVIPLSVDPSESARIDFKFVVDGQWTTSSAFAVEDDGQGNVNNYMPASDVLAQGKRQKIRVSRKYRRNKKTGERVLFSKESVEVDENDVPVRVVESVTYPLPDEIDAAASADGNSTADTPSETGLSAQPSEDETPNLIEVQDEAESVEV